MPDKTGALSRKEQKIADAWIKEHWKNWNCPFCGSKHWELNQHLGASRVFIPLDSQIGGRVYPFLIAMCSNCGYMALFNAIKIGILHQTDDDQQSKGKKPKK